MKEIGYAKAFARLMDKPTTYRRPEYVGVILLGHGACYTPHVVFSGDLGIYRIIVQDLTARLRHLTKFK